MNDFFTTIKRFFTVHPIIANLLLIFLTACLLVWAALVFLSSWTHHGDDAVVPQVKGLSYNEALLVLAEDGLTAEIADSLYDRHAQPGTVVESWPRAGAVVKKGRQVYVTVTAFSPKQITLSMPVIGVSSRQAVSYLEALGITSIRLVSVPSEFPDLIENAYADGRQLTVGSSFPVTASVTLEVGTTPVAVEPDSLDIAIDAAIDNLDFNED